MRTYSETAYKLIVGLATLFLFVVLSPSRAQAATDIFVKIEGIGGESQDKQHANWITALSFSDGLTLPASAALTGGVSAGRADFQNIKITKNVDSASIPLTSAVAAGRHIPTVTIEFRRTGANQSAYFKIVLQGVLIASVTRQTDSSSMGLVETVSLNASMYQWTYIPIKADGSSGPAITGGFDLRQNKPI